MINLSDIRVAYGDRILFSKSSFLIRPKDKIGLVGPNGSGKTTLFRLITGEEHPDDGTVNIDPGVVIGYFSQDTGEMAGKNGSGACSLLRRYGLCPGRGALRNRTYNGRYGCHGRNE